MCNFKTCPVCCGTGKLSYPPGVAGYQNTFVDSSSGPWPCHVCAGRGTLEGNGLPEYKMSPFYLDQINKGLGREIIRLQDELSLVKEELASVQSTLKAEREVRELERDHIPDAGEKADGKEKE